MPIIYTTNIFIAKKRRVEIADLVGKNSSLGGRDQRRFPGAGGKVAGQVINQVGVS